MADSIIKIPGTFEKVVIQCPKCKGTNITIYLDLKGYYEVVECNNCGYKKIRDK